MATVGKNRKIWLFSNFFMNMGRMVIPAIWDVFWDQTDLLTMLVRPPNTLSQKNRHPKKKFFGLFLPSQEDLTEDHNQTVRKMPTNEKNRKKILRIAISASFGVNLVCFIWKVSYFVISLWLQLWFFNICRSHLSTHDRIFYAFVGQK